MCDMDVPFFGQNVQTEGLRLMDEGGTAVYILTALIDREIFLLFCEAMIIISVYTDFGVQKSAHIASFLHNLST